MDSNSKKTGSYKVIFIMIACLAIMVYLICVTSEKEYNTENVTTEASVTTI